MMLYPVLWWIAWRFGLILSRLICSDTYTYRQVRAQFRARRSYAVHGQGDLDSRKLACSYRLGEGLLNRKVGMPKEDNKALGNELTDRQWLNPLRCPAP